MKRKFYRTLESWKHSPSDRALMVLGPRQVGKTYLINDFCQHEFGDYLYLNLMERRELVDVFEHAPNFNELTANLAIRLGQPIHPGKTVLFIDEIQESEAAITSLKFFSEHRPAYKIVCAGSLLGVKLKRSHGSFPVGRVQIEPIFPMDFEEFLWSLDKKMWLDHLLECFSHNTPCTVHEQLLRLYRCFLCVGGMPAAVLAFRDVGGQIMDWDRGITKSISASYLNDMSRYTTNKNEGAKIERIYRAIPSLLARENPKFRYARVAQGASKKTYATALDWLLANNMVYQCFFAKKIEKPLNVFTDADFFKLYFNDVGLLTANLDLNLADILLDSNFMFKGAMAENFVAQALTANRLPLYYWRSDNSAEIDFLWANRDGIIPIEVKAGDHTKSKSLVVYQQKYHPPYAIRLSTRNFGYRDGIKSLPLYAAFLLQPS